MKVSLLTEEQMATCADDRFNPPTILNENQEADFQSEIRTHYGIILQSLSLFGAEGDYYGISDFSIRPDLRDRATVVAPPAPHRREFNITVMTDVFFKSDYLKVLFGVLRKAKERYRIAIDQDFDSDWYLTIFLTCDGALLFCTDPDRRDEVRQLLTWIKE